MSGLHNAIKTANAVTRTLLGLTVLLGTGWVGWKGYDAWQTHQHQSAVAQQELAARTEELARRTAEIADLQAELAESTRRVEQLETAMALLKVSHRMARLQVIDQQTDPATGTLWTELEFAEVGPGSEILGEPRRFTIEGDLVYVDYRVVKFEDRYVEQSDLHRSTSICLFHRLFGEHQHPRDGYTLDSSGARPVAYARDVEMTDFEQRIWQDFWTIAGDPERARELGIRAAHGEAPYTKLRNGQTYWLVLRAADGLSIVPGDKPPLDLTQPTT